ncbi:hypothetical protein OAI09_01290 [Candidatus Pelagibacter sp.]|nr:hypothetical protein [Candidatus Pelagibacter sp.]
MNDLYTLRLAKIKDRNNIMSFIKTNWLDTHILGHDKKFFNYLYLNDDKLQFILAIDATNKIKGILGFIQYSPKNAEQDIFLALWKVIPNQNDPMLGIKLIDYLKKKIPHRYIHCIGVSKETIGIYKFLGYQTGKLDHYVVFNPKCKRHLISKPPLLIKKIAINSRYKFLKTKNINPLILKLSISNFYHKKIPFKSLKFLSHRYEYHPYFSYIFYEVLYKNLFIGFVVLRKVSYKNSQALRIIDIISADKNILKIIMNIPIILKNSDCEYIDVYVSGINKKILLNNNFKLVSNAKNIIVPNHFEPYKRDNIEIIFASSFTKKIIFFKGDGDKDHPRLYNIKRNLKKLK